MSNRMPLKVFVILCFENMLSMCFHLKMGLILFYSLGMPFEHMDLSEIDSRLTIKS